MDRRRPTRWSCSAASPWRGFRRTERPLRWGRLASELYRAEARLPRVRVPPEVLAEIRHGRFPGSGHTPKRQPSATRSRKPDSCLFTSKGTILHVVIDFKNGSAISCAKGHGSCRLRLRRLPDVAGALSPLARV